MTVRPFDLDQLARVSTKGIAAARIAATRLGDLDRRVELKVAPFGLISLRCLDIIAPAPPDDSDAIWALSRDGTSGRSGHLILDGLAALRIVASTLGLRVPQGLRPLGAAERGVVTATIATLLRAAASDTVVTMRPKPWRSDGLARLVVAVDFGTFSEFARLDVPPDWIPARPSTSFVADADRRGLRIPLVVELARTTLFARDWSRARSGDAVVFDEWAMLHSDRDWPVRVVCGAFAADAELTPDGRARMVSAFQNSGVTGSVTTGIDDVSKTGEDFMSSDNQQYDALTMLASAPIQVVAEIGRITLRADEITALKPGSIFTLGSLRPTIVDLRVGDRSWAHGELVDVDGQLGIRLTVLGPGIERRVVSAEADTLR